jgi:hypothetical protein
MFVIGYAVDRVRVGLVETTALASTRPDHEQQSDTRLLPSSPHDPSFAAVQHAEFVLSRLHNPLDRHRRDDPQGLMKSAANTGA